VAVIVRLFDTSAILVHYFRAVGAERVHALLAQADGRAGFCAASVPELWGALCSSLDSEADAERITRLYTTEVMRMMEINRLVSDEAWRVLMRFRRLGTIRSLVAATAIANSRAVLVHADPTFSNLPIEILDQVDVRATST